MIAKLAKAVEEGKISLDDGEEEPDVDEQEVESEEETKEDLINDYDNPDMTAERKEALKKFDKGLKLLKKKTSLEDATDFIGQVYETDDLEDEEIFDSFFDLKKRLIDDDGDAHELNDGYYLNGEIACCGSYLDDNGKCPVCGEEYDV